MRTYFLFFFFFLGNSTFVLSQVWTQLDTFPGTPRYGVPAFSVFGKGYLGGSGGNGSILYTDLYEFNPSTKTWSTKANFPGSPRRVGIGFATDSFGYVGLGWTGNTAYYDLYKYNPLTNSWSQVTSYPGAGGRNPFNTSLGGKGYVGGGASGSTVSSYKSDWWEYSSKTDTWSQIGYLPFGSRVGGISFSIGCLVYVGLGHNGFTDFKDLWEYNPSTNTWTQMPNFPGAPRHQAAAFVTNGKGIVGGGKQKNTGYVYGDYYAFDPISKTWTQLPNYSAERRAVHSGLSIGSIGYVGAGWDSNKVYLNDFWSYEETSCNRRLFMELEVCGSYHSPFSGKNYYSSGIYYDSSSSGGCDTIRTICLTVLPEYLDSMTVQSCDSFKTITGNVLFTSGTYYDTLNTFSGCDSVIKYELIIHETNLDTIKLKSCTDYRGPSGKLYTETGVYMDSLVSSYGCDSVFLLELELNTINPQIYQVGKVLWSATAQANYQWVDCEKGMQSLPGETSRTYEPQKNGYYAVVVTKDTCVDTSICYETIGIGISDHPFSSEVVIFPNPSNGKIHISGLSQSATLEIRDLKGDVVLNKSTVSNGTIILDGIGNGLYLVLIIQDNFVAREKLIITN